MTTWLETYCKLLKQRKLMVEVGQTNPLPAVTLPGDIIEWLKVHVIFII